MAAASPADISAEISFDAQVLPDGRLAVSLGDVSGHGAAASVLMTAAGISPRLTLSPARSFRRQSPVSTRIHPTPAAPQEKFVTLWTGIFDPRQMSLTYIDAGHGLAFLIRADKTIHMLDQDGGPPIGIDAGSTYHQIASAQLSPAIRCWSSATASSSNLALNRLPTASFASSAGTASNQPFNHIMMATIYSNPFSMPLNLFAGQARTIPMT